MPEERKPHPGFYEYVPEEVPLPKKSAPCRLEFESFPSAETGFESALDTLSRLKNELAGLKEDLEQQKVEPFQTPKLGLDEMAVTIHTLSGGTPIDSAANALLGQVASHTPAQTGNGITYNVYMNHSEQNPLLELDRRVDRLCKIVGAPVDSHRNTASGSSSSSSSNSSNSSSSSGSSEESMFARMRDLQARLELADEYKLDAIYRRTKSLVTEIDTLETPEQTAPGQDEAKAQQIEKLRKLLLPLSHSAQEVPIVLSRIKTRHDADERAARLLLRLKHLQATHAAVTRTLVADQESLLSVGSQMVNNAKTLTGNLQILQQRLKALS